MWNWMLMLISDDMMLANGIEQAVEDDAGAEVVELDEADYRSWWTAATKDRSDTIPHFVKAVRLVALSQISSAAVERVFSQLTFIH